MKAVGSLISQLADSARSPGQVRKPTSPAGRTGGADYRRAKLLTNKRFNDHAPIYLTNESLPSSLALSSTTATSMYG